MRIIELTSDTFDAFILEPGRSLIVFTASWCQPCQELKRILHNVFDTEQQWRLAIVDIEAYPTLAESFNVKSIPWVLVVRDGVVLYAESGVLNKPALQELMTQADELDMSKIKK